MERLTSLDMDEATLLLREALHLCHNGERAPGGDETWVDWSYRTERYLRAELCREYGHDYNDNPTVCGTCGAIWLRTVPLTVSKDEIAL